jgi:hypothetical protein
VTRVLVATTLAAFAMDQPDTWGAWLYTAEELAQTADVRFFAALETDARGRDPFAPLLRRLRELNGAHWTFSLDDGRTEVTTANRLRHLTMGQNLASEYATSRGFDWLLFCAADCAPPADVLPKLWELNEPLCGPEIPTYCLTGVDQGDRWPFPVHEQLISVACVLIRRDVFKVLRWRADPDLGLSDDPAYRLDAHSLLNVRSYVRKDVAARHYPASIGPIETRGHDLRVAR